jgi:phospholipase C
MDNFVHGRPYPIPNLPYAYVPQSEVQQYWTLASAYTLADRMFQSNTGPSFNAHQYLIAGQSAATTEVPSYAGINWGCDAIPQATVPILGPNGTDLPGPFPCFDYQTIADSLDAANISWKYYAPSEAEDTGYIWSAFNAIKHIRFGPDGISDGPLWTQNVISPETQVFSDIENGNLAQVTWVMPTWANSDHAAPPGGVDHGPDWVTSIVNEIGASQYWSDTVILIAWDDWGGWYDHVLPPQVDDMGMGFRVPLIVVSPYAKHGYISHQQHEFGSFLKFIEELYQLPSLPSTPTIPAGFYPDSTGFTPNIIVRDAISDDLLDCFDFTQTVQPYTQVQTTLGPDYFKTHIMTGPPDTD